MVPDFQYNHYPPHCITNSYYNHNSIVIIICIFHTCGSYESTDSYTVFCEKYYGIIITIMNEFRPKNIYFYSRSAQEVQVFLDTLIIN